MTIINFRDPNELSKEMGHVDREKENVIDERLWNSSDEEENNDINLSEG